MKIEINHDNQFCIDSKAHGIIKFDDFTAWRAELIDHELSELPNTSSDEIVLLIAKNNIKEIDGKNYDYSENKENIKNIKLHLSEAELSEFASKFLEENKYLTGEEDNRFSVSFGDGTKTPMKPDKDLINYKWPDNPLDKLKEAWLVQRKKQEDFVNKTLGLNNLKGFEEIAKYARKQQDLISGIMKPIKMPPITSPIYNSELEESIRSIHETETRIRERRASIDKAHLAVPELLEDLIQLQRDMYKVSTELQKAANKNLVERITQAKIDSNSAGKQSRTAIIIASVSLLASVVLGIIQISIAMKPNTQLSEQNILLKGLINQSIDEKNKLEKLLTDLNLTVDNLLHLNNYQEELDNIYKELLKKK